MLSLNATQRDTEKNSASLVRREGLIPGVAYGAHMETIHLQVDEKEFQNVFRKLGESSLLSLAIEGKKEELPVMVREVQRDPLSMKFTHVDFYLPDLTKEMKIWIPLVLKGEAPAVKELNGTLVKRLSEVEVKVKPKDSPKEIEVDISSLKTFEDKVLVSDIAPPPGVTVLTNGEYIVAAVAPPSKVEEELEKPIEEKVEEVEKVEKKKEKEDEESSEEGESAKEEK